MNDYRNGVYAGVYGTSLTIDLKMSSDMLQDLLEAKKHQTVTSVTLHTVWHTSDLRAKEPQYITNMFTIIGKKLPNMQKFFMGQKTAGSDPFPLPVEALYQLVSLRHDSLRIIHLPSQVDVTGTKEQFYSFCFSLTRCSSLKEFGVRRNCNFLLTDCNHSPMDLLVSALSRLVGLEKFWLSPEPTTFDHRQFFQIQKLGGIKWLSLYLGDCTVDDALVDSLFGNSCLDALVLRGQDDPYISRITRCLQTKNRHLKYLRLGRISMMACVAFLELLEVNTAMETICLKTDCKQGETELYASRLVSGLKNMPSLKQLELRIDDEDRVAKMGVLSAVFQGLAQNTSLFVVVLELVATYDFGAYKRLEEIVTSCGKAIQLFERSLERNLSLQVLHATSAYDRPFPFSESAKFWLKLNHAGKQELFERPHDHDFWLRTIIDERDDVNVLSTSSG